MKIKLILTVLFTFSVFALSAQKFEYAVRLIPDSLKQGANAVVRADDTEVNIFSQRRMTITTRKITTVLNDKGLEGAIPVVYYDKKTTVRNINATVYDALGTEIKKLKRKDFQDMSAADGFSIFSDSRLLALSYTPTQYPFTLVFDCETESSNTAFIPDWYPVDGYFTGVQQATIRVILPNDLGFKKKEFNFSGFHVNKVSENATGLSYEAVNIPAVKKEDFSPPFAGLFPKVAFGLEHFNLEGVDGNAKTWKEFGQWYDSKILTGTTQLPDETKIKIKALVGTETDPIKKARIVYNFVQQKSRYVSIQVGIGGWKPMLASDVDRLGYGDCKALSNYTRALLDAVGVPSYNTLLYGSRSKMDIQEDFVSMQGNHMILSVPDGKNYIWLECTSQTDPFGYQGIFTDDREVLVIKPDGGEILRTSVSDDRQNSQTSKGDYVLSETGDFQGKITIVSEGSQYAQKFELADDEQIEKEKHYKEYWSNINNLKILKMAFSNDKEQVRFSEQVEVSASNYATISGNRLLFPINAFNKNAPNVRKVRNRKSPFEIQRGFYDSDEVTVALPKGFAVEALPDSVELKTKFGEYRSEIVKNGESFVYKRTLLLKKGRYASNEYEDFRLFMEKVIRNDNSKMILIKS